MDMPIRDEDFVRGEEEEAEMETPHQDQFDNIDEDAAFEELTEQSMEMV